ncbi:MAG: hypothetical protein NXH95_01280 [Pseudomonadaceae bacterium]|nr:hypothetical protein [Pseudomonadaceae bacterium]
MNKQIATQTVNEITTHVSSKLQGIPGVTDNLLACLVFSWLRQEQPDVLELVSATDVLRIVEKARGQVPASGPGVKPFSVEANA